MVVARKKYEYLQPQEEQKVVIKQKTVKNYRFEKILLTFAIMLVFSLSLMLLTRFAAITEAKHQIHTLNNQLEQLKMQKERLKVEVERVSKSRWIEEEAIERLGMQYPLPEQVIYIHVPPTEVALLTSQINIKNEWLPSSQNSSIDAIYKIFGKIATLFKI